MGAAAREARKAARGATRTKAAARGQAPRGAARQAFGFSVPFLDLLGVHVDACEGGRSLVSLTIREELTNSWQIAHGGVVMSMLDVALATAALSTQPDSPALITVNLSVSFVNAGSGSLVAEGRVLRGGKSLVFCEGEVRGAQGEVVAKGVGTFKVRRRKDGREPGAA